MFEKLVALYENVRRVGFSTLFVRPTIDYWKAEPLHAAYSFFGSLLVMYLVMVFIVTINYQSLYCTSDVQKLNGAFLSVEPYLSNDTFIRELGDPSFSIFNNVSQPSAAGHYINCQYDLSKSTFLQDYSFFAYRRYFS